VLPTIRAVASPRAEGDGPCTLLGWVLPIDDTSFRIYSAGRVTEAGSLSKIRSHFNGKLWHELTAEEHRKFPGDFEAQVSQGEVTLHSEEHLASTDLGVSKLRHMLRRQLEAIAAGKDPMGVTFDAGKDLVQLAAGTSLEAKGAAQ
jgi:hypothetical protein